MEEVFEGSCQGKGRADRRAGRGLVGFAPASAARVLAAVAMLASWTASALDLVKDGKALFSVEAEDLGPERFAASEITRVVEAITGAEPLTNGAPVRIVIGTPAGSPEIAGAAARHGIALDPATNDTVAVVADAAAGALYCAGNNPRAAMCAAFTLLDHLGCRWFWPGEDGEFLPSPSKDLAVADDLLIRETAAFHNRQLSTHPDKAKSAFFAHNRMNPRGDPHGHGFTKSWGGHSFNWIWPEDCTSINDYFAKYPEQFAENGGVRVINQHCYTNPDTIRTFSDWICRFWEGHPDVEVLNLSARDTPIYCHCAECSKVDSSTLFFRFLNQITEEATRRFPGRRYGTIAYSFYLKPPQVALRGNISVSYCMYDRCYKHRFDDPSCPVNAKALAAMAAWKERLGHAPDIYGYHFDVFSGTPHYAALGPVLADEIRWARDYGVALWKTEYFGGTINPKKGQTRLDARVYVDRWPAYVAARMLWNPDLDYDALLDDYCRRVYGPAGAELLDYHRRMDAAWQGPGHASYYFNNPAGYADALVTDELVEALDPLFAKAMEKAAADPRAAAEVAFEKAVWERWRDLRLARDNWKALADEPDLDREDILLASAPGKTLYDPLAKGARKVLAETCTITNEAAAEEAATVISYRPGRTPEGRLLHDGLLFGNHPRFEAGPCNWVNYETAFDFRFPVGGEPPRHGRWFVLMLRVGGARLEGHSFGHVGVRVGEKGVAVAKHLRDQSEESLGSGSFAAPLGEGWHRLAVRLADTRAVITVDGVPVADCRVPLGMGAINIRSYAPLDLRGLQVRELPSPSVAELWNVDVPFSAVAPKMDGLGTDPAWEAGRTFRTFANRGSYRPRSEATLLRTDKALYLRFTGYGDMAKATTNIVEKDGQVYRDDGVELYLDPNNTRISYYWIVVNSAGVRCDAEASVGMNINTGWDGEWTSATSRHDDHWVIELAFPFSTFGEPAEGIPWLLGLNRCGSGIRQSWTDATYHSPNSFKTLKMGK